MILDIAADRYWLEVASTQPSAKTTEYQLANLIKRLKPVTRLAEIDDNRLADYVARRRGDVDSRYKNRKAAPRVSAAAVNREVQLLRRIMYRARDVWKVEIGDVDWHLHRLKEPAPRDRTMTADMETKLLQALAPHLRPAVEFSLLTGLRLANVVGLDWRCIDMGARTMRFDVKGGKSHRLPITEAVLVLLANQAPKDKGPVFTYRGRKIKTWKTAWTRALARAGLEDFRWHDLRHTAASRMVAAGVDISVVQDVLGHADIATTRRYVHHQQGAKRAALETLSAPPSRTIPEPAKTKAK